MDLPFYTHDGAVCWNAAGRPIKLTETEVERILDIFEREREPVLFNRLYEAHLAAGGIPRASSLIQKVAA